jgi:hypothetical protein
MKITFFVIVMTLFSISYALTPSRQYAVKPSDFGLTFEELKINTSDGLKLNAWYFLRVRHLIKLWF